MSGYIITTIVLAVLLLGSTELALLVRERRRDKTRCSNCGHPTLVQGRCTECGLLPGQSRKPMLLIRRWRTFAAITLILALLAITQARSLAAALPTSVLMEAWSKGGDGFMAVRQEVENRTESSFTETEWEHVLRALCPRALHASGTSITYSWSHYLLRGTASREMRIAVEGNPTEVVISVPSFRVHQNGPFLPITVPATDANADGIITVDVALYEHAGTGMVLLGRTSNACRVP